MNFPSTMLPQSGEPAETQKAVLDLLAKINQVAGELSGESTSSLPKGYLYGLTLSNGTDANNDIDIAAGECVDSAGAHLMVLDAVLTKRLDGSWEQGTNGGGLDTGAKAISTTYHVHLIRKDVGGTIDALFSTSPTAPTMPAGWTARRRIGSIMTDGSGNIIAFFQTGDRFDLDSPVLDVNETPPSTARQTKALTVPTGIIITALIRTHGTTSGASTAVYVAALKRADLVPVGGTVTESFITATTWRYGVHMEVETDAAGQIGYRASSVSGVIVRMATDGWIDRRGRDAA